MSIYTDGDFTVPRLDGGLQIQCPFADIGNYYARTYTGNYIQLSANYTGPYTANRTQWTNLLLGSRDFSNAAYWTNFGSSDAAGGIANAGDGTMTGVSLIEDNSVGFHGITQTVAVTPGRVTFSVMAKLGVIPQIYISINDYTGDIAGAMYNLSDGSFVEGTSYSVVPMPGGWFWFTVSAVTTYASVTLGIYMAIGGTRSYAGNGTDNLWICDSVFGYHSTTPPVIVNTASVRTVTVPDMPMTDAGIPIDPYAFLVQETAPELGSGENNAQGLALGVSIFQRVYARVPAAVSQGATTVVSKPDAPNAVVLGGVSPLPTLFYASVTRMATVATVQGGFAQLAIYTQIPAVNNIVPNIHAYSIFPFQPATPNVTPSATPTGGTYVIAVGTYNTAGLSPGATTLGIQAAVNALPPVSGPIGGCFVNGTISNGITVSWTNNPVLSVSTFNVASWPHATYASYTNSINFVSLTINGVYNLYTSQTYMDCVFNGSAYPYPGTFKITINGTVYPVTTTGTNADLTTQLNALASTLMTVYPWLAVGIANYSGVDGSGNVTLPEFFFVSFPIASVNPASLTPTSTVNTTVTNGGVEYFLLQNGTGSLIITWGSAFNVPSGSTFYVLGSTLIPYAIPYANLSSLSAFGVTIPYSSSNSYYGVILGMAMSGQPITNYQPGARNARCLRTTTFYLPGYTEGVGSPSSIAPPTVGVDQFSFFNELESNNGLINYQTQGLNIWKGPIYAQSVDQIYVADMSGS